MKRRSFLCASALSVAATLQASAEPFAFLSPQEQWLSIYLKSVGAKPAWQWLMPDEALDSEIRTATKSLKGIGYKSTGTSYYCNNNSVVFYPVKLSAQEVGLIDVSVLAFTKDAATNHSWKYTHTFSGFDLEAICHSLEQLPALPVERDAIALYVPVYVAPHQKRPYTVQTAKGKLELKVKLDAGGSTLEVKVLKESTTLIAASYLSRNNMSTSFLA
jgi:hypothetical protein